MIHLTKICACTVYWWKWTKATCMADFMGCQYPFRWWYYHDPWRWYRFNASPKDCTDTGKLKLENFLHFMLLMRTYRVVVICLYVCKSKAAVRLSSNRLFEKYNPSYIDVSILAYSVWVQEYLETCLWVWLMLQSIGIDSLICSANAIDVNNFISRGARQWWSNLTIEYVQDKHLCWFFVACYFVTNL